MDYNGDTPEDVQANVTFSTRLSKDGGVLGPDMKQLAADFFKHGWEAATTFWLSQGGNTAVVLWDKAVGGFYIESVGPSTIPEAVRARGTPLFDPGAIMRAYHNGVTAGRNLAVMDMAEVWRAERAQHQATVDKLVRDHNLMQQQRDELLAAQEARYRIGGTASCPAMSKTQLTALMVGDVVTRMLAGTIPMRLKVTQIDDLIHCGPWAFHRETGCEVDLEIGWDGVTQTGSFLTFEPAQ